jgi:hypothetical protein
MPENGLPKPQERPIGILHQSHQKRLIKYPLDTAFSERSIDHDLDLTTSGDVAFDIAVPAGDSYFDPKGTGTAKIYMNRSIYDSASGTTGANVQKQTYTLTYKPKISAKP